ncbi:MAG: hypothetical protein U5K56_13785 [Halioglobus sp.]|nr:hypothetical protein [Halioglobus sp.]
MDEYEFPPHGHEHDQESYRLVVLDNETDTQLAGVVVYRANFDCDASPEAAGKRALYITE